MGTEGKIVTLEDIKKRVQSKVYENAMVAVVYYGIDEQQLVNFLTDYWLTSLDEIEKYLKMELKVFNSHTSLVERIKSLQAIHYCSAILIQ